MGAVVVVVVSTAVLGVDLNVSMTVGPNVVPTTASTRHWLPLALIRVCIEAREHGEKVRLFLPSRSTGYMMYFPLPIGLQGVPSSSLQLVPGAHEEMLESQHVWWAPATWQPVRDGREGVVSQAIGIGGQGRHVPAHAWEGAGGAQGGLACALKGRSRQHSSLPKACPSSCAVVCVTIQSCRVKPSLSGFEGLLHFVVENPALRDRPLLHRNARRDVR